MATEGSGHRVVEPPVLGGPDKTDFYLLGDLLTDEQQALRHQVREFMDREVISMINPYWERADFPFELVEALIVGRDITRYNAFVPATPTPH
jgi:glutaryl-CoA dehydrogenase